MLVPFAVVMGRLLSAPSGHIYLPDDLALIDLHTREALRWKQQLGVFDRNGWSHPGPAYFYLLSVAYRVLGDGARSLFVGATAINAAAAAACLGVVRRRTTPTRTLWAAVAITILVWLLADTAPGATTYSEGALGALVSPWNPLVVILPLLLLVLLGAAAMDRSVLSLVGAAVVASFLVQTDLSVLPLVLTVVALAGVVWTATVVVDRRGSRVGTTASRAGGWWRDGRRLRVGGGVAVGGAVLVAMWLPPLVQQVTNRPGNMTLIVRFFDAGYPGYSLGTGVRALTAVYGVLVSGTSEVMTTVLGSSPRHAAGDVGVSVVVVATAAAVTLLGVRQRNRFAAGLGALGLAGTAASVMAVTRVVGLLFGYLLVWAIVLPVSALIGAGTLRSSRGDPAPGGRAPSTTSPRHLHAGRRVPRTASTGRTGAGWIERAGRMALAAVASAACLLTVVRVVSIPALTTVSDPQVAALVALVTPALGHNGHNGHVYVSDWGAGAPATQLLDVERFIGLVDALDQQGDHPTVSGFWRAQFGPGFVSDGTEQQSVLLTTWGPAAPGTPGYLGRVGNMAVTMARGHLPATSR